MTAHMTAQAARAPRVARYTKVAITLHWIVAALIVVNIFVGLTGAYTDDKAASRQLIDTHKSIGLTLFGLVALRLLWRFANPPPALPAAYPRHEKLAAHGVHWLLYAAMILLPITGYIHDSAWKEAAQHPLTLFGLPFPRLGPVESLAYATREYVHDAFGAAHIWIGYALYTLLALHLLGVAKHHAIDHERELQRMLPEAYRRPGPVE